MTAARAELIEDRGEAAADAEFFRSRPFLDAEGVTHTLRIESDEGELLAPLIVREIPDTEERDAVSPYGYPGVAGRSRGHVRRSNSGEAPATLARTPFIVRELGSYCGQDRRGHVGYDGRG